MTDDALLTETDAALHLKVTTRTLADWRRRGIGPPVLQVERTIRYRRSTLDAWIDGRTLGPWNDPHDRTAEGEQIVDRDYRDA